MKILLDTAPFWWLASNSPRLSSGARAAYVDPTNEIFLSPICIWELIIKHQIGKLPLEGPFEEILRRAMNQNDLAPLPVSASAVAKLLSLPALHKDPFDRMLICQALDNDMTLLTPDPLIKSYPVNSLW